MNSGRLVALASVVLAGMLWTTDVRAADGSKFDSNGDGLVTFQEVMKYIEPSVRKSFDAMDRNKDGVLSDKDFDDLREGLRKLEEWLDELLIEPFAPESRPENEVSRT